MYKKNVNMYVKMQFLKFVILFLYYNKNVLQLSDKVVKFYYFEMAF